MTRPHGSITTSPRKQKHADRSNRSGATAVAPTSQRQTVAQVTQRRTEPIQSKQPKIFFGEHVAESASK